MSINNNRYIDSSQRLNKKVEIKLLFFRKKRRLNIYFNFKLDPNWFKSIKLKLILSNRALTQHQNLFLTS
jgi:hypothetical protein